MDYSKKELAEICGVSVQAIDKKLRKTGLMSSCRKVANRLQIPWEIAATIATDYEVVLQPKQPKVAEVAENQQPTATVATKKTDDNKALEALSKELEILHRQLEIKDKQIADLSTALVAAQDSNKALSANAAMHTVADKKEELALESTHQKEERKSRWQRLKEAWRG